jgi:hypothetical protein
MIIDYKYITFYKEFEEPQENYNVISCTVFRMKKGYKNELKYYDGLKLFVENYEKYLPDFYFRLYYDDSVLDFENTEKIENTKKYWKPLFDKMRLNKKIQLIKYEMKDFKIDKLHHNGVIGTMTRFYPMFEHPDNKKIKCVITSDIDITKYVLEMLKLNLNKMEKAKVDFFYLTMNCYELQDRFQILTKTFNIKFPMLAGTIISKIKFPFNFIDDFFYCILNMNDPKCEYYKIFNTTELSIFTKHVKKDEIKYGIDELFTLILKKYLYKNKIKHMISFHSEVARPFYLIFTKYQENKISKIQFINVMKFILQDIYDDKKSPEDNYKILDDIVFFNKNNIIDKHTLLNRLINLFKKIKKNELSNENYGFTDEQIDCGLDMSSENKYYIIDYVNNFDDKIQKIEI